MAYLTFDLRGHGDSSGTIRELTLTRGLEDLSAILAGPAAPFRKIVLIGSSMGATRGLDRGLEPEPDRRRRPDRPSFSFYQNRLRDLGEGDSGA